MKVVVLTPTYQERENLRPFVRALFAVLPTAELLVIDDNSPDGTGHLADELASVDPRISVLHRPLKGGLGSAYVAGFRHALSCGYDVVIEMDADLSHDARHLPSFLRAIAAGADVVSGSRSVPGGGIVGWGPARSLLSAGGSAYARAILGIDVRDLTTGFKAYTRRALLAIEVETLTCNGYAFQIETTFRALQADMSVAEVPIVFVDRRVGESKLDYKVVVEAVLAVWRMRFSALRGG